TNNDLPLSLRKCNSVKPGFAQAACYSGVYMENFNADKILHPSHFLYPRDPLALCHQEKHYPVECYMNSPFFFLNNHPDDFIAALQWCDNISVFYRWSCYENVGVQATKRIADNPTKVESICMSSGVEKIVS